jgi:nickel-dependent lactate racemase
MTRTEGPCCSLSEAEVAEICARECARWGVAGKRVLAVVPDATRSAPMAMMFRVWHELLAGVASKLDVLIALGTHPPMSEAAIDRHFGLTSRDGTRTGAGTTFHNHRWDDPGQLVSIGSFGEDEVESISGGLMREAVEVTVNKLVLDYDLLLIIGPTFPHEVAGFSGGNKYIAPGISGRGIIDMFHWLGALITNPAIVGTKHTPVRAVIDRVASMVPVERKCASLVVDGRDLVGVHVGTPEEAWSAAVDQSRRVHVRREKRPFRSVLSCAPAMYGDLWVGGKCAYKLEPVVADGGELIIHAPHISRVSSVHGAILEAVGYHVRDYFVKQWDRFAGLPRGVLAHSTHVKGVGEYEGGVERPRIEVALATQLSEDACRALNLGYRDYRAIDVEDWKGREGEGKLFVARAGETLYRLEE